MGLLTELRLRFRPPRRQDPIFGELLYMHIARDPKQSYWEGEWLFPSTGSRVAITLPGALEGPQETGRKFYLQLAAEFDEIMQVSTPVLDGVFREWIGRPLNADVWQDVTLGGFSVEDPGSAPVVWDIGFETKGNKWLGITIPFIGDEPQDPVVDT